MEHRRINRKRERIQIMLEELKQKVYEANMELPRRGLITYTWGKCKRN